jgi:hypothetical protein
MMSNPTTISAILAVIAAASPIIKDEVLSKRWQHGYDCTQDIIATQCNPGLLLAVDSQGSPAYCSNINVASIAE